MKEEFLKNRWLLLEKGSKTSERTTLFLTALSTGSLTLYLYCVRNTQNKKNVTENRPFALGGGAPGEVEILRGPTPRRTIL